MLSDESLQHAGSSDSPESVDISSKKKKSFHPLRSLKKFFGHGSNSRRRSTNDDSTNNSSALLKAKSTTDVVILCPETTEDTDCAFQRTSKQISLSADSIFSTERICETNLPVSAISSEALLHSENCGAGSLLHRKDDDDGLPQSPITLTTTAELFIENGLKQDQSEKWPSFDSGHSLLSVDSNENEAEEDFFKEKWVAVSKSLPDSARSETSAADSLFHKELDLNLVQRHSSLSSSAAIHRLAVRPTGKRVSSIYQQKLSAAPLKLTVCGKSLPLVKEESGTSAKTPDADHPSISESLEKCVSAGNTRDTGRISENECSSRSSCATEIPETCDATGGIHEKSIDAGAAKRVNTVGTVEKVNVAKGNEVTSGFEKTDVKKSGEKVVSVKTAEKSKEKIVITKNTEDIDQGETVVVLQKQDLKREKISSRAVSNTENAEESSKLSKSVTDQPESETSLRPGPAKQTITPIAAVVVRKKPPRAVVPSAQDIREMAARRQTLAFSEESETGMEKPVSKRSSLVIPDQSLIPSEGGNTELAQMFSKFQRRSSQKKQTQLGDAKPVDDISNSRVDENTLLTVANSKPVIVQIGSKEQVSLAKVVPEVKNAGKLVEVSPQGKGGSTVGLSGTNQQIKMANSMKYADTKVEACPETSESSTSRGKRPEKYTETTAEKATEKNDGDMNTESKSDTADQKEASVILKKSENVKTFSGSSTPPSDEKTKGVKKSYSISYKVTKSPADKPQQGTVTNIKTRSSSQSEPPVGEAEVPTKSCSSQVTRRGSFTYSHQNEGQLKACPASSSENSSRTESRASTTSDNSGRTKDVQYKPPSVTTATRPSSRSGIVASSSGMVPVGSRMVPAGSGAVSYRAALTQDRLTAVSHGSRVVPRVIVGPGAVKSTGVRGVASKESAVSAAPQDIPPSDKSSKEAKLFKSASEKSSHKVGSYKGSEMLTGRDVSQLPQKTASIIGPVGGQKTLAGKEGESQVEWVGVARQKTKAWKEGKVDAAEKVTSGN